MKTDFEKRVRVHAEADAALAFSRQAYGKLGPREFYQQSVLKLLAVIVKLLMRLDDRI